MAMNYPNHKETVLSVVEAERNLRAVVQEVQNSQGHAVLEESGTPVAILLSVDEYQDLLRYRRLMLFDTFTRELGQEVERRGLTEEELMAELEVTKREVVNERYGRHD